LVSNIKSSVKNCWQKYRNTNNRNTRSTEKPVEMYSPKGSGNNVRPPEVLDFQGLPALFMCFWLHSGSVLRIKCCECPSWTYILCQTGGFERPPHGEQAIRCFVLSHHQIRWRTPALWGPRRRKSPRADSPKHMELSLPVCYNFLKHANQHIFP